LDPQEIYKPHATENPLHPVSRKHAIFGLPPKSLQQPLPQRFHNGAAARVHLQLGVDIPQVRVDGVRADEELLGDPFLRMLVDEEL